MRALLAGLFVFGGLLVCVGTFFHCFPDGFGPPWLMGLVSAGLLFVLVGISMFLFNRKGYRPRMPWKSFAEQLAEWEKQGLIESDIFQAIRAFQLKEFEDEGPHYFIELADHGVLYVNGQYLYDYEEITDDPELNRPRTFPCSQFTMRRHKTAGYVINIICTGAVLPLDCLAPSFDKKDFKNDLVPEDGQVIRDKTYDELQRERLKENPA